MSSTQTSKKLDKLYLNAPSILKRYIEFRSSQGKSLQTIYCHGLELLDFFQTVLNYDGKSFDVSVLSKVTPDDIKDYLSQAEINSSTYRTKLSIIKRFYDFLIQKTYIKNNPAAALNVPKTLPSGYSSTLTPQDIQKTLYGICQGNDLSDRERKFYEKTKYRDICLVTLFLNTGITLEELITLETNDVLFEEEDVLEDVYSFWNDVDPELPLQLLYASLSCKVPSEETFFVNGQLLLPGHRKVHFNKMTGATLLFYLAAEHPRYDSALFLSLKNRRMSERSIQNVIKKYFLRYAGIPASPQMLREYHRDQFIQKSNNLTACAGRMGYKNFSYLQKVANKERYSDALDQQYGNESFY